jgi:hypothetical protein
MTGEGREGSTTALDTKNTVGQASLQRTVLSCRIERVGHVEELLLLESVMAAFGAMSLDDRDLGCNTESRVALGATKV